MGAAIPCGNGALKIGAESASHLFPYIRSPESLIDETALSAMASSASASRKTKDPAGVSTAGAAAPPSNANPGSAAKPAKPEDLAGLTACASRSTKSTSSWSTCLTSARARAGDRPSQAGRRRADLSAGARARRCSSGWSALNQGPLSGEHLRRIFSEIISACTALEHPSASRIWVPSIPIRTRRRVAASARAPSSSPRPRSPAVFQALDNERADYGVVPVENSTEGSVSADARSADRHAAGDYRRDPAADSPRADVARGDAGGVRGILSHQQSLGQCRNYLAANYPHCELEAVASNRRRPSVRRRDPARRRSPRWRRRAPTDLR